ncbi:uncharacterized protein TNCV_1639471 [Trichonephila clavipes]|nr:uncharacterized protein TNCV_1639471 [Trichonephila clavipes]
MLIFILNFLRYFDFDFRKTPLVSQLACLPCAAFRKEENGVLGILYVLFKPRFFREEENGGMGILLRSLWPTLRCRRVAGVSPLLSIGWWYFSSVSPKRHCCRISAADKGCRFYPLHPRPDAVALYSGCTPGRGHLEQPEIQIPKLDALKDDSQGRMKLIRNDLRGRRSMINVYQLRERST